jgi:hypothetical protein
MKRSPILIAAAWLVAATGCGPAQRGDYAARAESADLLRETVKNLTDVIVYDIFSPPVASRVYAYPSVAAYEVLAPANPGFQPLAGQLRGLTPLPQPAAGSQALRSIAAVYAFQRVGEKLVFSADKMASHDSLLDARYLALGVPRQVLADSKAYADEAARHILAWADQDNYKQTRTFERFSVTTEPGRWTPTPPAYMDAIEPHWNKIRPFVIDSATQFVPARPSAFDTAQSSPFFREMKEVYEVSRQLSTEQKEIAAFWDCNPFVMNQTGHVMFATKKISPGGHWMGITDIATRKAGSSMMETAEAFAWVALALADGFISCWDEKYRSSVIRPETVINKYLDPSWQPLLQTPPFPEYTSGHSVISNAAALALTHLYGPSFAFTDSVEVEFGLPPRTFSSFVQAAEEAAVSRLYGGIHYMPAIQNGSEQGKKVGSYIVSRLRTRAAQAPGTASTP